MKLRHLPETCLWSTSAAAARRRLSKLRDDREISVITQDTIKKGVVNCS